MEWTHPESGDRLCALADGCPGFDVRAEVSSASSGFAGLEPGCQKTTEERLIGLRRALLLALSEDNPFKLKKAVSQALLDN